MLTIPAYRNVNCWQKSIWNTFKRQNCLFLLLNYFFPLHCSLFFSDLPRVFIFNSLTFPTFSTTYIKLSSLNSLMQRRYLGLPIMHLFHFIFMYVRTIYIPIAFDNRVKSVNILTSTCLVAVLCMCVCCISCMCVCCILYLRLHGYLRTYAQMMQHTYMYKAVTRPVEAKKLFSRRRQNLQRKKNTWMDKAQLNHQKHASIFTNNSWAIFSQHTYWYKR